MDKQELQKELGEIQICVNNEDFINSSLKIRRLRNSIDCGVLD